MEDVPAAWLGVEAIREAGLQPRALVQEGQRPDRSGIALGEPLRVPGGLQLHTRQGRPQLLGLDDPCGPGIHEQDIVGDPESARERELADRNALGGVEVNFPHVLHGPSSQTQAFINELAGRFLRSGHGKPRASRGPSRIELEPPPIDNSNTPRGAVKVAVRRLGR